MSLAYDKYFSKLLQEKTIRARLDYRDNSALAKLISFTTFNKSLKCVSCRAKSLSFRLANSSNLKNPAKASNAMEMNLVSTKDPSRL